MRNRATATTLVLAFTLGSLGAAPPVVYHSPTMDGVNPGTPQEIAAGTLDLYIAPGTADSSGGEQICLNGSGDEICGFTVQIEAAGGASLDAFTPDPAADLVVNLQSPGSLTVNRLNGAVGDTTPVRLGSLDVTLGPGGEIRVAGSSEAIGASLQRLAVADNGPIALPEPGVLGAMLCGVLALAALRRMRRR